MTPPPLPSWIRGELTTTPGPTRLIAIHYTREATPDQARRAATTTAVLLRRLGNTTTIGTHPLINGALVIIELTPPIPATTWTDITTQFPDLYHSTTETALLPEMLRPGTITAIYRST